VSEGQTASEQITDEVTSVIALLRLNYERVVARQPSGARA
jgi:hypothetical protein